MEKSCELCICSKKQEEIIFQTENFYIRPSLGHLVEGYLLVCSKKHLTNLSELPENQMEELEKIKKSIRKLIQENYSKKVIFFEHGPIKDGIIGKSCIDHAHLHAVPFEEDILRELTKNFTLTEIGKLKEIVSQRENNKPYLYYENQEERKFLIEVKFPLPSQYFRQIIASRTKEPYKWNWKVYPEEERFKETLRKLKNKKPT